MSPHTIYPTPHVLRNGTGTPLVFVHGNGVDHRLLLELDDVFAQPSVWERIYVDLPGFGQTPPLTTSGGLPELAAWLNATIEGLIGSARFAIVANSLGGLLARNVVAQHLDQCLGFALLAPVVDPITANRNLPQQQVLKHDPALLATLSAADAESYCELAVVQSEDNWQRFQRAALPGIRAAQQVAMDKLAQCYALPDFSDEAFDGYQQPVLIVTGKQDWVVGYHDQWELSQRFDHATYAVLDRAGHNVHLDQPHAVKALLSTWATRLQHNH